MKVYLVEEAPLHLVHAYLFRHHFDYRYIMSCGDRDKLNVLLKNRGFVTLEDKSTTFSYETWERLKWSKAVSDPHDNA